MSLAQPTAHLQGLGRSPEGRSGIGKPEAPDSISFFLADNRLSTEKAAKNLTLVGCCPGYGCRQRTALAEARLRPHVCKRSDFNHEDSSCRRRAVRTSCRRRAFARHAEGVPSHDMPKACCSHDMPEACLRTTCRRRAFARHAGGVPSHDMPEACLRTTCRRRAFADHDGGAGRSISRTVALSASIRAPAVRSRSRQPPPQVGRGQAETSHRFCA